MANTKRALLTSVLAIVACVAMLIGSAFAWFTDTASTGVNKITSGTLHVEIQNKEGKPIDTLEWVKEDGTAIEKQEDILWEPGCTYLLTPFKIVNTGTLALKYKIVITGLDSGSPLLDVIKFTYKTADGKTFDMNEEGHLAAKAATDVIKISAHMDENAGNDYQGKTLEGVKFTVYATQYTHESDSFDDQYDKDATYLAYPAGKTEADFADADKAMDAEGNTYTSFKEALENVADGGALYFKKDSVVDFPTHLNVTKSVTIYGNGADFSGKDISIGTYAAPESNEVTVNIYNTKNLVVWGQPIEGRADVWNINFYGCENNGYNFLMYRGSESGTAKIDLTMTDCKATGYKDSIVHTTADGTITIKNCTFADNCAPINIAHKQAGSMTITVEDCTFTNCGKVNPEDDYFAPARFVNNSETGTLTVSLKNNTFTGTIGTNGDILLGDYRTGKASHALTATIVTKTPVMVKASADDVYSFEGGTITLN